MRAHTGEILVVAAVATALCVPPSASASFAGAKGLIAYVSVAHNCPDLHTVAVDGSGDQQLTNCPAALADPAWNSLGNRIAVSMSTSGGSNGPAPADLYTMGPTGASAVRVTNDTVDDGDPYWSKDGGTLVEGRVRSGPGTQDVATVASTGGTPVTLVAGSPGNEAGDPQYSPDGTKIAFEQRTGPIDHLYVMNANGSGKTDLTPNVSSNSLYPTWSPDGKDLAFASDRDGVFEIFVVDVSGGSSNGVVSQITHETTVADIQATWSPDQTMIAFTHGCADDNCQGQSGMENGDIDVVNVADLSHPGTPQVVVGTANPEFGPDWGVACSSNCAPPPPTDVTRTLTLALSGQLKATGELADPTGKHPECAAHKPVQVQRFSSGAWHTVSSVQTNTSGDYFASMANRAGTYRAVAPAMTLSTSNLLCHQAVSAKRTRTLMHARTIPYFNLAAKPDGSAMFANGGLKATHRFDPCTTHQLVRIQKRSGSSWTTIAKSKTITTNSQNGQAPFGVNIPIRNGEYRAVAPKVTLSTSDVCGAATSAAIPWPPG